MTAGTLNTANRGGYNDTVSSGADINVGSNAGFWSTRFTGTIGVAGKGGEGLFGGSTCATTQGTGASFDGLYGGGGSGASVAAASIAGGIGGAGCVYIEEFY